MSESILKCENLCFSYDDELSLNNISLNIKINLSINITIYSSSTSEISTGIIPIIKNENGISINFIYFIKETLFPLWSLYTGIYLY